MATASKTKSSKKGRHPKTEDLELVPGIMCRGCGYTLPTSLHLLDNRRCPKCTSSSWETVLLPSDSSAE